MLKQQATSSLRLPSIPTVSFAAILGMAGTAASQSEVLMAIEWHVFGNDMAAFHTIDTGSATPALVGTPQLACSFEWTGMTWDAFGDRLLSSAACAVFEVDINTGLVNPLFNWGISPMDDEQILDGDIAADPLTGDLYVAGSARFGAGSVGLWRVPLGSGSVVPEFVGNGLPSDASGMTFTPEGTILALSVENGGEIYEVDPATSSSVLLGQLGLDFGTGPTPSLQGAPYSDIAIEPSTGTLYVSAIGDLYAVDPVTFQATFIGTHGLGYDDGTTILLGVPGMDFVPGIDCVADTNGDGMLTPADFNAWILAFNTQSPACDQNGDSMCTPADFNAWILNFNAGCP